jgi:hypothetical protein
MGHHIVIPGMTCLWYLDFKTESSQHLIVTSRAHEGIKAICDIHYRKDFLIFANIVAFGNQKYFYRNIMYSLIFDMEKIIIDRNKQYDSNCDELIYEFFWKDVVKRGYWTVMSINHRTGEGLFPQ